MFPKRSYVGGLGLSSWHYRVMVELRMGPSVRSSGVWGHALEGHLPLPSFLARDEELCSTICSCNMAPGGGATKTSGPTDHGLKPPKLSQNETSHQLTISHVSIVTEN